MRFLREPREHSTNDLWTLGLVVAAGAFAAAATARPSFVEWLPECPLHRGLGLLCPGCGLTRATLAVFAGRLDHALACNPLVFWIVPVGLYLAATSGARLLTGRHPAVRWPPVLVGTIEAGFVLVWLLLGSIRLLTWLAPGANPLGLGIPPPA